jgi:chorismate dehydratase
LNLGMRAGELDVSAASSIEYASAPDEYLLVPNLAIGARGHVRSVLLLSRHPVAKLDGREIAVTSQTHTSAALLGLFLRERVGIEPRFAPCDVGAAVDSDNPPEALLAIGDEALRLRGHPAYPHRWDMGSAWMDWTSLPFIFGVWLVSRRAAKEKPEEVAACCRALLEAKEWSRARMDRIAALAAGQTGWSQEAMETYFQGLVFDLGEREREGLSLFYDKLARAGAIGKAPELEFFELGGS